MDLGNRGYLYTLLTSVIVVSILSFIFFYITIFDKTDDNMLYQMKVTKLQNSVHSIVDDYQRVISITTQRATVYTINEILTSSTFLPVDYVMHNCSAYNYSGVGAPAVISELMVCSTYQGQGGNVHEAIKYMENHTIQTWINRTILGLNKLDINGTIELSDLKLTMYDPLNILVSTKLNIHLEDELGSRYSIRNHEINTIVSLEGVEDPYYVLKTGKTAITRRLEYCDDFTYTDKIILQDWVTKGCVFRTDSDIAPSFFDRLEGQSTINPDYDAQTRDEAERLHLDRHKIGIETLVNEAELIKYMVVASYRSQFDYIYFNPGAPLAFCKVDDVDKEGLKLNAVNVQVLNVSEVTCTYYLWDNLNPGSISIYQNDVVPLEIPITFNFPGNVINLEFYNLLTQNQEPIVITPVGAILPVETLPTPGSKYTYSGITSSVTFQIEGNPSGRSMSVSVVFD